MKENQYAEWVQQQRDYFAAGKTRALTTRRQHLRRLLEALQCYEKDILQALQDDLGKSDFEGYMTELGMVKQEIRHCLRGMRFWSLPTFKTGGWMNFPAYGCVYHEPYGVVLIIAPWNYPFQLCLIPLVGALAAGNCVMLKTSEFAPHTSELLARMLGKIFPSELVQVIEGSPGVSAAILREHFDYIFFTGSPQVGTLVMQAAARFLTPVTLELGGKSPCLVCDDSDLSLAARRIVWGKLLNAGQTCVAPDYILVSSRKKPLLIQAIKQCVREFLGENPLQNQNYPHIIHRKHFEELLYLMHHSGRMVWGGEYDAETLKIAPTILDEISWEDPVMQQEIFGPIFPVLVCESIEEMIARVKQHSHPLALYLFTKDRKRQQRILREIPFGGGCINDTIMHLSGNLPFGGVGNSGMGRYHGKQSFMTFTYEKSVLKKAVWLDIPLRYPPYRRFFAGIKRLF